LKIFSVSAIDYRQVDHGYSNGDQDASSQYHDIWRRGSRRSCRGWLAVRGQVAQRCSGWWQRPRWHCRSPRSPSLHLEYLLVDTAGISYQLLLQSDEILNLWCQQFNKHGSPCRVKVFPVKDLADVIVYIKRSEIQTFEASAVRPWPSDAVSPPLMAPDTSRATHGESDFAPVYFGVKLVAPICQRMDRHQTLACRQRVIARKATREFSLV
jgi:hypothetical protein